LPQSLKRLMLKSTDCSNTIVASTHKKTPALRSGFFIEKRLA
jgi:hypothetical protein